MTVCSEFRLQAAVLCFNRLKAELQRVHFTTIFVFSCF